MQIAILAIVLCGQMAASTIVAISGDSIVATDQFLTAGGTARCQQLFSPAPAGECSLVTFVNVASEIPNFLEFGGWSFGATLLAATAASTRGELIGLLPSGSGLINFLLSGRHSDGRTASGSGLIVVRYLGPMALGGPWEGQLVYDELASAPEAVAVATASTPEPASFALAGIGIAAIAVARRRAVRRR